MEPLKDVAVHQYIQPNVGDVPQHVDCMLQICQLGQICLFYLVVDLLIMRSVWLMDRLDAQFVIMPGAL
ncbi:hypothetical protein PVK06_029928 [Gossypium arboreum]|uniref:Uncharacterized protein n=1 Tax=Gossypium arboreum TaxID=29729 RepID=A0ABR0NLX5_GOSAR|nr:hypothetical protein PVK06_029928 [Gossypium arboreum]